MCLFVLRHLKDHFADFLHLSLCLNPNQQRTDLLTSNVCLSKSDISDSSVVVQKLLKTHQRVTALHWVTCSCIMKSQATLVSLETNNKDHVFSPQRVVLCKET